MKRLGHRKFLANRKPTDRKYFVLGFITESKVVVFPVGATTESELQVVSPKEETWEEIK